MGLLTDSFVDLLPAVADADRFERVDRKIAGEAVSDERRPSSNVADLKARARRLLSETTSAENSALDAGIFKVPPARIELAHAV